MRETLNSLTKRPNIVVTMPGTLNTPHNRLQKSASGIIAKRSQSNEEEGGDYLDMNCSPGDYSTKKITFKYFMYLCDNTTPH